MAWDHPLFLYLCNAKPAQSPAEAPCPWKLHNCSGAAWSHHNCPLWKDEQDWSAPPWVIKQLREHMRSYKNDEFTFHRESSKLYAATYKNVNCTVSHWDLAVVFWQQWKRTAKWSNLLLLELGSKLHALLHPQRNVYQLLPKTTAPWCFLRLAFHFYSHRGGCYPWEVSFRINSSLCSLSWFPRERAGGAN